MSDERRPWIAPRIGGYQARGAGPKSPLPPPGPGAASPAPGAVMNRCPRCNSRAPHLHPAVQFEGEVELCTDDFHLRPTNQNNQERIEMVLSKRARLAVH